MGLMSRTLVCDPGVRQGWPMEGLECQDSFLSPVSELRVGYSQAKLWKEPSWML